MYKFKQFMLQAQKQKKCPPGYRFDKKLQVCVPIGVSRYYPYLGGVRNNTDTSNGNNNNNRNFRPTIWTHNRKNIRRRIL